MKYRQTPKIDPSNLTFLKYSTKTEHDFSLALMSGRGQTVPSTRARAGRVSSGSALEVARGRATLASRRPADFVCVDLQHSRKLGLCRSLISIFAPMVIATRVAGNVGSQKKKNVGRRKKNRLQQRNEDARLIHHKKMLKRTTQHNATQRDLVSVSVKVSPTLRDLDFNRKGPKS